MKHLIALIAIVAGPLALVGNVLAGTDGALLGAALGVAILLCAWCAARPVILSVSRARELAPEERPDLSELVNRLSHAAGIRRPLVAISSLRTPNAFAAVTIGGGVVGVTSGLLEVLTPEEIEAVVAHEIAHLSHRARSAATIAAVLVAPLGALAAASGSDLFYDRDYRKTFIRTWGGKRLRPLRDALALCTVPLTVLVVRASVSSAAELEADRDAARLTGNAPALRSALRKIDALAGRVLAPVNPAVAQLLLVHPFGTAMLGRIFDAHPPLHERLAALDSSCQRT